jgi:hypothetical protein
LIAAQVNVYPAVEGILSGSHLGSDQYYLWQFHFHWGTDNSRGAEHAVNGEHDAAEVIQFKIMIIFYILRN